MKKLLAIGLVVILMFSMSIPAFAAENGGFLNSPSKNPAPEVTDKNHDDDDCDGEVIITPYKDRDELSDEAKDLIEKAYDDIAGTDDLTDLCDDIADIIKDKNIKSEDLAVSDLFDVDITGCDEEHHNVTLDVDTADNFVALMQIDEDGKWSIVKDAKLVDGKLVFKLDFFSPLAIVVNKDKTSPQTHDNTLLYIYAAVMLVSAAAVLVLVKVSKSKEN